MTELKLTRDAKGLVSYGINFSDTGQIVNLAAAAKTSLAIPAGATFALFQIQPGATVLVSTGNTEIPDVEGSFTGSTADINPAGRSLYNASTLQFYAIDAALVKVSFYTGSA